MSDMWALYDALTQPSGWRAQAACLGMDTDDWFPLQGGDCSVALAVCRTCPVAQECLDERMAEQRPRTHDDGVYGGTTTGQRKAMRAGRMPQTANPPMQGSMGRRVELRVRDLQQPAPKQGDRGGRLRRSPRPEVGDLDNCGTEQGYQRHRGRGETPCGACTDAHRDAYHERGAA